MILSWYMWLKGTAPGRKSGDLTFKFQLRMIGLLICSKMLSTKADFQGLIPLGSIGFRNKGSRVLYSPWASDHLCKGKGIPITGHEGPRGMWMQGSTYSQPRHLEEVGWLVLRSASFTPGKFPGTPFIGG